MERIVDNKIITSLIEDEEEEEDPKTCNTFVIKRRKSISNFCETRVDEATLILF